jgi:hypothetical protein
MNVYDFKGPGVALSMYNTDEVSSRYGLTHRIQADSFFLWHIVYPRVRAFVLQDGHLQEDAPRKSYRDIHSSNVHH